MHARAWAGVNIALVKYWGKRDEALNLPLANSLSLTLDRGSTTTVELRPGGVDRLRIDGLEQHPLPPRVARLLDALRGLGARGQFDIESLSDWPVAAGLASSASAFAALSVAATHAAGLALDQAEIARLARLGSGSACRSIPGGWVEWIAGARADGSDSLPVQLAPANHWDLAVLAVVVDASRKSVASSEGMRRCQQSSPLYAGWLATMDADLVAARSALSQRDFQALGRVAERSAMRLHACNLGADPPLRYLQPRSWGVIETLEALRGDGLELFYTVDAGPNIKVFCPAGHVDTLRAALASECQDLRLLQAKPGGAARLVR